MMSILQILRGKWITQIGTGGCTGLMLWLATIGYVQPLQANGSGGASTTLYPEWWKDRDVVDETLDVQNQAIVNLGQLKWISTQLKKELDLLLPLGSGIDLTGSGGAFGSPKVPTDVGYDDWSGENRQPANLGQAKNIAKRFYDVLNGISPIWVKDQLIKSGIPSADFDLNHSDGGIYYPWTVSSADDENYVAINLGQLKLMFALRVRSDTETNSNGDPEGLPDLFELALAGLGDADYSTYIGSPEATNPFFGKSISEITMHSGSPVISYYNGTSWVNSSVPAPFPGLASANASVSDLLAQHQAIGSVGGSFSTGGDGSANYSIPINIPKGTAGMEPSIAIGYSSNGGNGALGVGFDLSGFQRITRGATSRAKEDRAGIDPVDFDSEDRFFLDGELLVAVDGVYGAPGTEYRTENDGFARIISWGYFGSGPEFWTVETKAGLRIELGNCQTSCIQDIGGKGALVWGVNKVSDNIGNYYEVVYDGTAPAGEVGYRVKEVNYTGYRRKDGNNVVTHAPFCRVAFEWETREDVTRGVIHGVKICNDKRLKAIHVGTITGANGENLEKLHSYEMTYDYSSHTRRSRLKEIVKNYPSANPLPATVFNWSDFNPPVNPGSVDNTNTTLVAEGRQRWFHSSDSSYNYVTWSSDDGNDDYIKMIDLNGDGLPDRVTGVKPGTADYGVWVSLNRGNGFAPMTKWFEPDISSAYSSLGSPMFNLIKAEMSYPEFDVYAGFYDVNGDGLPDRVQCYDFSPAAGFSYSGGAPTSVPEVMDLMPSAKGIMVALNNGSGFGTMHKWFDVSDNSSDYSHYISWNDGVGYNDYSAFIDMNADGIPDRVDQYNYVDPSPQGGPGMWVSLGLGYFDAQSNSGFENRQRWYFSSSQTAEHQIRWGNSSNEYVYSDLIDMNGDGILDKVDHFDYENYSSGNSAGYGLYVSLGRGKYEPNAPSTEQRGFHPRQRWLHDPGHSEPNLPRAGEHSRFFDINNDGLPDRVDHYNYSNSQYGIWVSLNKGGYSGGSGFHPKQRWLNPPLQNEHSYFTHEDTSDGHTYGLFKDMNGDGLPDRVQYLDGTGYPRGIYVALNMGLFDAQADKGFENFQKWFSSAYTYSSHNFPVLYEDDGGWSVNCDLIDMNADGLPDRVMTRDPVGGSDQGFYVALNKGEYEQGSGGFEVATKWFDRVGSTQSSNRILPVWGNSSDGIIYSNLFDINGDGFLDRLDHYNYDPSFTGSDPYGLWVSLNTGTGFIGDGGDQVGNFPVELNTSEMIHSITDGLGAEIRVEYKRMNDPSPGTLGRPIYTREDPTAAEFEAETQARIIRAPGNRWAVSRYAEEDGLGGWRWASNFYGGRKFDQHNEVDLGFRWVETFDESRNRGSISIFHQNFPFEGQVRESISYLLNGNEYLILSKEEMEYRVSAYPYDGSDWAESDPLQGATPFSGKGTAASGGKVRFIHLKNSISSEFAYDTLTGHAAPIGESCLANGILPSRNFVGRLLKEDRVTSQTFSAWGDLVASTSQNEGEGILTTSNIYDSPVISDPANPYVNTPNSPSNLTVPIDSDLLFGKWILGRLTSASTTQVGGVSKTSTFTYYDESDPATAHLCGMLKTEIAQPSHADALVQEKIYDKWGNIVKELSYPLNASVDPEGTPIGPRWTETAYDTQHGRFPISSTNQLGHTSTSLYDEHRALLLSTTEANGLTTRFYYDEYSTRILTRHPDGTESAEITAEVDPNIAIQGVLGIEHKRVARTSGSPASTVYLDGQGRPVLTESIILSDTEGANPHQAVYTKTTYDHRGREVTRSLPFFSGDTVYVTTVNYDNADRVCKTVNPDLSETKVYHDGYLSELTNGLNQKQTREVDTKGRMVKSTDHDGNDTTFEYDSQGNLIKTIPPDGYEITATFDIFGNKLTMTDPNIGTEIITYNAFGQIETTTDSENNSTTHIYDAAGRVIKKKTKRAGVLESTTNTVYVTSGAALGKVHSVEIDWEADNSTNLTVNAYDRLGRTVRTDETRTLFNQSANSLVTETSSSSVRYDDLGRVRTQTNAGGLTTLNLYDSEGFSVGLRDYNTGDIYWKPLTYDASGRLLTERLGNGVETTNNINPADGTLTLSYSMKGSSTLQFFGFLWDDVGNLKKRNDYLRTLEETFTYDNLNRLKTSTVGTVTHSVDYGIGGNITKRSSNVGGSVDQNYSYHATSKHQLTAINNTERTYQYDANGSLTVEKRNGNNQRLITWGGHGKITQIWQKSTSKVNDMGESTLYAQANTIIKFDYDAGINRVRQTMERNSSSGSNNILNLVTTDYFGSYERIRHQSPGTGGLVTDKIEHRHTIGGVAIKTFTHTPGSSPDAEKIVYQLKDHLGSTSALLDAAGAVIIKNGKQQVLSYDSWGQRRDAQTWLAYSDAGGTQRTSTETNRGYTGHEMLDEMGLVHMNGRIYDSEIGRFLSADPHIQSPENGQNYNRYTYVLNNPLSYSDPSGYFFKKLFKSIGKFFKSIGKVFKKIGKWIKENWRTIVMVVVAIFAFYVGGWAASSISGSNALGSATGLAIRGSVAGALTGGVNAAINGGNFQDILKGALIGGIQGGISGGVLHGYQANGEIFAHIAGHGIVGGAANVAMGGKFADGFIGGAAGAGASWLPVIGRYLSPVHSPLNIVGRTALAGVIGGTVSAVSGGKFANGAYTSAFQHLLNAELTKSLAARRVKLIKNSTGYKILEKKMKSALKLQRETGKRQTVELSRPALKAIFRLSYYSAFLHDELSKNAHWAVEFLKGGKNKYIHGYGADTIIRRGLGDNFSTLKFRAYNRDDFGGDVNYLAVGMLLRGNGHTETSIVSLVKKFNALDFGGTNIEAASRWALWGSRRFDVYSKGKW